MIDKYFGNIDDLDAFFDDDVLGNIVDEECESGKHDSTNYSGYYKDAKGDWYAVNYSCSYNNGVEYVNIDGPYQQVQETVVVNKYIKKKD